MTTNSPPPLSQAPPAMQLAVDLIMLLEQHNLEPELVLAALAIVNKDFKQKAKLQQSTTQIADD